ncbi:hypothetical protein Taro_051721 [Colocasia esculenta]|uniref:Uncharacterized protein n=1 Tax=Colocasia esculenta TaxID=4460 RepID=A0A843XHW3_COLES|nr:hypothetical protein [Colocasia esculenta]
MEGRRVVIAFGHPSSQIRNRNIVNVTVELYSFGRPKKEKLERHLRPLREATTTTWSKYFLGHSQPSQPGSQPSQPTIHHRQRETSDVREHPEDIHRRQWGHGREAKRIVHRSIGRGRLLFLLRSTSLKLEVDSFIS